MTYPIYTTEELDGFKRNKLWTICKRMKLKCRPSAQDCRNAIAAAQPQPVVVDEQTSAQSELEAHVEQQCRAVASDTCATCPHYQAFDGEQRGYCPLRDGVVRPHFPKSDECRHLEEMEREFVAATPAPEPAPTPMLQSVECPACHGDGCQRCGYLGLQAADRVRWEYYLGQSPQYDYRLFVRGSVSTIYHVHELRGQFVGKLEFFRNHHQRWENTPDTWRWRVLGQPHKSYRSPSEAIASALKQQHAIAI